MEKKLICVRILQHDTEDEIKIGVSVPITEDKLDKYAEGTIKSYDKRLEWCGGFIQGCKKYYKRIALVDADTLEVIKVIYEKK